jgi:hypothetical protein
MYIETLEDYLLREIFCKKNNLLEARHRKWVKQVHGDRMSLWKKTTQNANNFFVKIDAHVLPW